MALRAVYLSGVKLVWLQISFIWWEGPESLDGEGCRPLNGATGGLTCGAGNPVLYVSPGLLSPAQSMVF